MTDNLEGRVTELAIAAAGPVGSDQRAWLRKVNELTPVIASLLRTPEQGHEEDAIVPQVTARKVLQARVFKAVFVGFEVEENTKRLLVAFKSDTADDKETDADGLERLRTEPWWTPAGFAMRRRIENLPQGTPCNVFKYVEEIEGGRKKVRVLVHFEAAGKPRTADDGAGTPAPPSQAARPAQQQAASSQPAAAPQGDSGQHADLIATRFDALAPRQRVAFGRLCAGRGIPNFMDPTDDQLDQVLLALAEIEKNKES